jgi:hypothetical protein
MALHIIGAGMAGLLAANVLRRHDPIILERNGSVPHNHHALLRFRTDEVAKALKIPFREVEVRKAIFYDGKTTTESCLKLSNMYSAKVTGAVMSRSIMDLSPCRRWIAPPNLIDQMAQGLKIIYGANIRCKNDLLGLCAPEGSPIISTISLPQMANLIFCDEEMPEIKTESNPIWTITGEIETPKTDVFQTIYFPEHRFPYYRASITSNQVIIESSIDIAEGEATDPKASAAFIETFLNEFFGIKAKINRETARQDKQLHGKILPIKDDVRKSIILALTDLHGIYSLGRFATWRQILMDDLVKDIDRINSFITQRSTYSRRLV